MKVHIFYFSSRRGFANPGEYYPKDVPMENPMWNWVLPVNIETSLVTIKNGDGILAHHIFCKHSQKKIFHANLIFYNRKCFFILVWRPYRRPFSLWKWEFPAMLKEFTPLRPCLASLFLPVNLYFSKAARGSEIRGVWQWFVASAHSKEIEAKALKIRRAKSEHVKIRGIISWKSRGGAHFLRQKCPQTVFYF